MEVLSKERLEENSMSRLKTLMDTRDELRSSSTKLARIIEEHGADFLDNRNLTQSIGCLRVVYAECLTLLDEEIRSKAYAPPSRTSEINKASA